MDSHAVLSDPRRGYGASGEGVMFFCFLGGPNPGSRWISAACCGAVAGSMPKFASGTLPLSARSAISKMSEHWPFGFLGAALSALDRTADRWYPVFESCGPSSQHRDPQIPYRETSPGPPQRAPGDKILGPGRKGNRVGRSQQLVTRNRDECGRVRKREFLAKGESRECSSGGRGCLINRMADPLDEKVEDFRSSSRRGLHHDQDMFVCDWHQFGEVVLLTSSCPARDSRLVIVFFWKVRIHGVATMADISELMLTESHSIRQ